MINRNIDIINNSEDLEHLYTYKNFPVFMGCTENSLSNDIFFDMSWWISKSSGFIQLNPLLPLDIVYQNEHGSGTVGKLWNEHHLSFLNFIKNYKINSVLEIGGGHGFLSENYLKSNDCKWTIVEPNPTIKPSKNLNVIKGFFDSEFNSNKKHDAVIHSHLFEHIYDPNGFLQKINDILIEDGIMIFSIPNMEVMLKNYYANCINFEHTIFLTEPYVEYLLNKFGFEIINKEYYLNDHSIFYCAKKVTHTKQIKLDANLYIKNKQLFFNYINFYKDLVQKINKELDNNNVFLFSAHIFSQNLISFGLNTDKIISVLDNDTKKQGKRLYGTNLKVLSPDSIKNVESPLIILKAGVYTSEIEKQLININKNSKFIK